VVPEDDWRRQGQERYLAGQALRFTKWWPYREGWDHDHCEFCWAEFSAEPQADNNQTGYVTSDDSYHWICSRCFADFREEFRWRIIESA
jgi:Zn-finger protein